jgi:hypothetical protein
MLVVLVINEGSGRVKLILITPDHLQAIAAYRKQGIGIILDALLCFRCFVFPLLDIGCVGRVSIGIYKGLNFQSFMPEVLALILSILLLLLLLKTSEDGKAKKNPSSLV